MSNGLKRPGMQGVIETYVDSQHRVGALVELGCETDFVARTEEMRNLAREVAMQVAATDPKVVGSKEKNTLDNEVLLNQEYVRDARKTIGDLITEMTSKVGERVWVQRFVRWEVPRSGDEQEMSAYQVCCR